MDNTMNVKEISTIKKKSKLNYLRFFFFVLISLFISNELAFSQEYQFTMKLRRKVDQIHAEIYAKSRNNLSPRLGFASLVLEYNTTYLKPAAQQNPSFTDTVSVLIENPDPIDTLNSAFHGKNGYTNLQNSFYGDSHYSLELNLANLGVAGIRPDTLGRGSYLGKIVFDIVGNPTNNVTSDIKWSTSTLPGDIRVFDTDSNDIESKVTFINPANMNIIGISILNPNMFRQVVDRDESYPSLTGDYKDAGYPIFFERTLAQNIYKIKTNPFALDEKVAYAAEYSTDAGATWVEFGRFIETNRNARSINANPNFYSGDILNTNSTLSFMLTGQEGRVIDASNYKNPLRFIWKKNNQFNVRSDNALMRITLLDTLNNSAINSRLKTNVTDVSDFTFLLGKMFFAQLNGTNQFFKTEKTYSNPTQLTVEAWVNLSEVKTNGNPGIVATASGNANGEEGAWMLYLENGNKPAFRAREILGRGAGGYIAKVVALDSLKAIPEAQLLDSVHTANWTHIAATVENNKVKLYVNGELVADTINTSDKDIRMLTTEHPVWVGVNPNGGLTAPNLLHAGIKGVRVWRTALSQDQIRDKVAGIVSPSTISSFDDIRGSLELLYTFEGRRSDFASNLAQGAVNDAEFYTALDLSKKDNLGVIYRPDAAHITLTSPTIHSGINNDSLETNEIRWVSYGLGDISRAKSNDIEFEYSVDSGKNWFKIKTPTTDSAADAETSTILWAPFKNNNPLANLRAAQPLSKKTYLRARGNPTFGQQNVMFTTDSLVVARFIGAKLDGTQAMFIKADQSMNIQNNKAFFEAWISPSKLPDSAVFKGYPIIRKTDPTSGRDQYNISLLPNGQIKFSISDNTNSVRTALSDSTKLIPRTTLSNEKIWSHVAVLVNTNAGNGKSEVVFYIDGVPQKDSLQMSQLGAAFTPDNTSSFPTYIASRPLSNDSSAAFSGEIREIRIWNGIPNALKYDGSEPSELTQFLQGAINVRAEKLTALNKSNLFVGFSFNNGSFIDWNRTVKSSTNPAITLNYRGSKFEYVATTPYLKVVEPAFRERVLASKTDVKVRWIGFDFDGTNFPLGTTNIPPALEFSLKGGGGNTVQPYQYFGSKYWDNVQNSSLSFPDSKLNKFTGSGTNIYFASITNFAIADPDKNDDGKYGDQGPLAASLTNARLRLHGTYSINGQSFPIESEGPLFTIIPESNFNVRVVLEGHHNGAFDGRKMRNIARTYQEGGIRATLYEDKQGVRGNKVASAESNLGYEDLDPINRARNNNKFANVNFLFPDIADGYYWVLLEQINHLPVMSRFPAQFIFAGDNKLTWDVESGWDFTTWNGNDNNTLPGQKVNPWNGKYYSAKGDAMATKSSPLYTSTGLIFNLGAFGDSSKTAQSGLAGMVGGDVNSDGQINAADRVRVRQDDGTNLVRSDVTGDGFVNGDDRTIVDRNAGKVSSLINEFPNGTSNIIFDNNSNNSDIHTLIGNENINESKAPKSNKAQASAIDYEVKGVSILKDDYVYLSVLIKNIGSDFALANSTFALKYDTTILKYVDVLGGDSVKFTQNNDFGYYSKLRSAPDSTAINRLLGVRTIEIDYGMNSGKPGIVVPKTETYLGTLRFKLINKNSSVSFAWHESSTVNAVDGQGVTEFGKFKTINSLLLYTGAITFPNGGENFLPQRKVDVKWTTTGSAKVYVEYSTNAGLNWARIKDSAVNISAKTFAWILPNVQSDKYMVRLVDSASSIEVDRSDKVFTVQAGFAQITSPSSSDALYHGDDNQIIKYKAGGYDMISFEFSIDGGKTWPTKIVKALAGTSTSYTWKLPKISSQQAMIRMIDNSNNSEIARSTAFKIISGTVTFKNPVMSEKVPSNITYRVKWNAYYMQVMDLELSTDGGASWTTLEYGMNPIKGYYDWAVPFIYTNQAQFRATYNGDPEMIYGASYLFTIGTTSDVGEEVDELSDKVAIYPIPAENELTIDFNQALDMSKCSINFTDIYGNNLSNLIELNSNKALVQLHSLANGTYYLNCSIDNKNFIRKIIISK